MSVDRDATFALEDHATERLTGIRAADALGTSPVDDLETPGTRLQQRHDFGQRIDHHRTLANEIRMIDGRKYGPGDLSYGHVSKQESP
jgi:hypothetical protein